MRAPCTSRGESRSPENAPAGTRDCRARPARAFRAQVRCEPALKSWLFALGSLPARGMLADDGDGLRRVVDVLRDLDVPGVGEFAITLALRWSQARQVVDRRPQA